MASAANDNPGPPARAPDRPAGLLAGMRIRKKLIFLHTAFSLVLAGILGGVLWPASTHVLEEAELHEAKLALSVVTSRVGQARAAAPGADPDAVVAAVMSELPAGVRVARGGVDTFGWPTALGPLHEASMVAGAGTGRIKGGSIAAWVIDPIDRSGYVAVARLEGARAAVNRLFILVTVALLAVYAIIAAALEVFVLPRHVYRPIREILRADRAVHAGNEGEALVAESHMPADELGEIMRSRNRAILALRQHERDLARALSELATSASDLRRKNHLLETAQRNLADADRLASLGIMSAGLAHELNTPLAVAKGLVEKLAADPAGGLDDAEAQLLRRVVTRLENLSESLLDFARVRPPSASPHNIRDLIDEAWTLVRLDRDARDVACRNGADPALSVACDGDRMLQVLVNLLRNAVDAMVGARARPGAPMLIDIDAACTAKDDRAWVSITIADTGPGIDPEILGRLFEPFASTRLDSRGTGLGLAVSEGIVREHGGVLLARTRANGQGSVFEIVLPVAQRADATLAPSVPEPA